jgi:hypothetical protein
MSYLNLNNNPYFFSSSEKNNEDDLSKTSFFSDSRIMQKKVSLKKTQESKEEDL